MGNENYLQMLKYGEWLEKLYSPDLKGWQMRSLANEANMIFQLDFSIGPNDPILVYFEKSEEKFKDILMCDLTDALRDPESNMEFELQPEIQILKISKFHPKGVYILTFQLRFETLQILKYLLEIQKPWQIAFPLTKSRGFGCSMGMITRWGSALTDGYISTESGFKKAKTISEFCSYNVLDSTYKGPESDNIVNEVGEVFPWHIVIAKMFISFLESGGQDYYGFCEHCGRFFLVQRKGRKQYCSHKCRSYASLIKHGKIKQKKHTPLAQIVRH